MKGLIIRDPWIDLILDGLKTWEIRGNDTKHRGHTELIKSGTGMIHGSANLVSTKELSLINLYRNSDKHGIQDCSVVKYTNIWAWIFENPVLYSEPIPYKHPQGAVIWVNLEEVMK
jgi:hypothetical protein